jgi:hypothetical protein
MFWDNDGCWIRIVPRMFVEEEGFIPESSSDTIGVSIFNVLC